MPTYYDNSKDRFAKYNVNLDSPLGDAFVITANDNANAIFSQPTRGLYVGTGGNINLTLYGQIANTNLILYNVPNGELLPLRVLAVNATSTTANNLVGLY